MTVERDIAKHEADPEPGRHDDPHRDPEERRRVEEERRRQDEERNRRDDEMRRTDKERIDTARERAEELRTADQERLEVRTAGPGTGDGTAPGEAQQSASIPVGFLDPIALLLEQAGPPPLSSDPFHPRIIAAVEKSADRLDLVMEKLVAAMDTRMTPEKIAEVRELLDEDLPRQLREWQQLCGSNPFDLVGIADGADAIARTIRRYLDRLARTTFAGADMGGEGLAYVFRSVATQVAAQLAVAADPVAMLTAELAQLGNRDRVDTKAVMSESEVARREARAREAAAMSPADYWARAKEASLAVPKKRSGESLAEEIDRERAEEWVKEIRDANVLDQGLRSTLEDWQRALARKDRGAELFEVSLRAASILMEYDARLESISTSLDHPATMLRHHLQYLATRMATELSRASGADMPRLIGDLDRTAGGATATPPDQRLDQLSKRLPLDRFWQTAKANGSRAVRDKVTRSRATEAFDKGLGDSLAAWDKAAYREPLDNRSLHQATTTVHDIVAEYRARLAEIASPELDQLDDALRLCVIRMNDHLRMLASAGAFLTPSGQSA